MIEIQSRSKEIKKPFKIVVRVSSTLNIYFRSIDDDVDIWYERIVKIGYIALWMLSHMRRMTVAWEWAQAAIDSVERGGRKWERVWIEEGGRRPGKWECGFKGTATVTPRCLLDQIAHLALIIILYLFM